MAARDFSKASSRGFWRRFGAAALLALSFSASALPAFAQQRNTVDRATAPFAFNQAAAPAIPADLAGYIRNEKDAPEITALKTEFAQTKMGLALLRFAMNNNVAFELDASLDARHSKAEYAPAAGKILIKPGMKLEPTVVYAAHEIRHAWQDKAMGAIAMENGVLTPWQRWTLRRYLEADAEAFASYFAADRLNSGAHIGPGFAEAMPASLIAMRLRGELWSRNGLTFGEYRQAAFEPALESLHTYNSKHLDYVEEMTLNFGKQVLAAGGDKAKLAQLEEAVQKAPDDAAFAAYLRHFGGVSLNPEAQTGLQSTSVTSDMLLNDYPRREKLPQVRADFPPRLDKKIADLTALQDSYIRVLHNASGKKPRIRPGA